MPREKKLTSREISAFCAQISMILKSSIPVEEGLAIMQGEMENEEGKKIVSGLLETVGRGEPLHAALLQSGRFPKYMVDMVEIGTQSGRLDEVMDSLCEYYQREEDIASGVRSAVTYPLIMIAMMVLVIGVLLIKVLPVFAQVFEQLGSEMSAFARSVMALGSLIGRYSALILGVLVLLALLFWLLRRTEGGRRMLDRFLDSFFLTRKLRAKIASGRFAAAMALMLSSGLDTDQSLEMAKRLVDNERTGLKIARCQERIAAGESFSQALGEAGLFGGIYARMVAVGFKTGSADTVMGKLADRYEEEIDAQIASLVSVLEPTLVAILSVIVGMVLLSVMLPLMGIMSSIG